MRNNLKKTIVATVFCTVAAISALALETTDEKKLLEEWSNAMPESIEGISIFPFVEDDGKIHISEIMDFPKKSRNEIFVNLYENIRREFDDKSENIDNIDVENRKLLIHRNISDSKAAGLGYEYSVAFQATDNMLLFLVYDISIRYREKGIIPRNVPINKMNPRGNRHHKELISDFSLSVAKYINSLADAISKNESLPVTHWKEISCNQVVPGMNFTEVILSYGMPNSERKSGSRIKWIYGNEDVVIFTDGLVTTVI